MSAPPSPRASVVAAFGLHALLAGTLGPRMPALKDRAGVDDGQLGLALAAFAAGLLLGTRLAGPAMRRWGSRRVVLAGVPLGAGALVGPALARDLPSLAAGLALFGAASGVVDVAMNTQAVTVERAHGRAIMSGIHAVWGAGMLLGGLLATALVALGVTVPVHFGLVAASVAGIAGFALRGLVRRDEPPAADGGSPVPARHVLALGVVAFAAFIGEGALADWSAIYLDDVVGTDATLAAAGFTVYALGLTASRLVADRLVRRHGAVRVARASALLAAAALGLGLGVPEPAAALAAFGLFGAAVAPIVPLAFSAAGNLGRTGALGWVVTAGYTGSILGPAAIGAVAEEAGLRAALLIVVAAAALVAPLAGRLRTAVA